MPRAGSYLADGRLAGGRRVRRLAAGLCQQLPTCTLSNYYIRRNACMGAWACRRGGGGCVRYELTARHDAAGSRSAGGVQTRQYVLRYLVAGSMPTCYPGSFDPGTLLPEPCFCEKGTVLNGATGSCDICPTGFGSIGGLCQQCVRELLRVGSDT